MNSILKYSPIITAILIFTGFLKLYIYYDFFNIDIINYLDFSEIITSFLDDIVLLLSIILPITTIVLFSAFFSKSKYFNHMKNEKEDVVSRSLRRYRFYNKFRVFITLFANSIITILGILVFFKFSELIGLVVGVFFLFNIVSIFSVYKTGKILKGIDLLLVISIILFLATYLKTYKEVRDTKVGEFGNYKVYINDGTRYVLSKNDYIIGKTKNYLFLSFNEETLIIPEREIKKIAYKLID